MINLVFNGNDNLFTFMAAPNPSAENSDIDILDELLNAVSGAFASFAASIDGDTEENYKDLVKTLTDMLKDEDFNKALDECLEDNEDGIFLNNEPKEEAVKQIAYGYKEEMVDFKNFSADKLDELGLGDDDDILRAYDHMLDDMEEEFVKLMDSIYGVDVKSVFESNIDEFEDDLF